MKNIDEKELHEIFDKMRKDDKKSYEELYKKYYKLVYNIAFSILKNKENAEDISQNVFIKIGNLKKEKLPNSYEICLQMKRINCLITAKNIMKM